MNFKCEATISRQIAKLWAICEEIRPEPDMNREVEFLFDYGSPFSYLANLQIEGFAQRNGAEVTYTPILLGAVLKATGNASPMTVPALADHAVVRDFRRNRLTPLPGSTETSSIAVSRRNSRGPCEQTTGMEHWIDYRTELALIEKPRFGPLNRGFESRTFMSGSDHFNPWSTLAT